MATINSIGSNKPIEVAFGGTGNATLTAHGVLLGNGTSAITPLAAASTGQTLMGSTGADPSFTGSPSFSGSVTAGTTLTASSGAITATSGNVVITSGNLTLPATTASVGQIILGGNRWGHSYGNGGTADANTFVGRDCGNFTLTGGTNNGFGFECLKSLTNGATNAAFGNNSQRLVSSGSFNASCGAYALSQLATGSYNCSLGYGAGNAYTGAESSNIQIGGGLAGTAGESNVLRIGTGTGTGNGNVNTAIICGITGKTSTSGVTVLVNSSNVLGTTTSSIRFKDNIQDMGNQSNDIFKLRPVTFTYKVSEPHVDEEGSKLKQFGLIAEEVEQVMPDQVTYNLDGNIESVRYLNFIPMLINEIQKLRKEVEELKRR